MNLVVALINAAVRLTEISVRILIQLMGFAFSLLSATISAAAASRGRNFKTVERLRPLHRPKNRREAKWRKRSQRRR